MPPSCRNRRRGVPSSAGCAARPPRSQPRDSPGRVRPLALCPECPPGTRLCQDLPMTADQDDLSALVLGVLGGTGDQGRGLARRFALAGHRVIIGSRDAGRAAAAAAGLGGDPLISGTVNAEAAAQADVVIAAIPWDGHKDLLAALAPQLAGKIVIDCVNPMGFDGKGAYALPVPEGSAAQQAAAVLPDSTVVGAFHHVSAELLLAPGDRPARPGRAGARRRPAGYRPGVGAGQPHSRPSAASTRAGCATAARSRPSPRTWSRSTAGTRRTPGSASPTSDLRRQAVLAAAERRDGCVRSLIVMGRARKVGVWSGLDPACPRSRCRPAGSARCRR